MGDGRKRWHRLGLERQREGRCDQACGQADREKRAIGSIPASFSSASLTATSASHLPCSRPPTAPTHTRTFPHPSRTSHCPLPSVPSRRFRPTSPFHSIPSCHVRLHRSCPSFVSHDQQKSNTGRTCLHLPLHLHRPPFSAQRARAEADRRGGWRPGSWSRGARCRRPVWRVCWGRSPCSS